jgi:hypothetical protein
MNRTAKRLGTIAAGGMAATALGWAGYAATAWLRYGRETKRGAHATLLDRFMPRFEVAERHETTVAAPATITWEAAREMDIQRSRVVRALFRGREILMRSGARENGKAVEPGPLVSQALALGWGVLAEDAGREIVMGAVTQPWAADPRFERLPPDEFAAFDEPGYVKIAWNLSVEAIDGERSVFRTETRVATTDAGARRRFRRYWAVFSPGILLIRRQSLGIVKAEAERRLREAREPEVTEAEPALLPDD